MSEKQYNLDGSERHRNKNGEYRKAGSGRKKGSTSIVTLSLAELVSKLPSSADVCVGRRWAENVGIISSFVIQKPIEAKAEEEKVNFNEINLDAE